MNDTPEPDHGTVSFWPTDDNGIPTAPPVTYELAGPVEVIYEDREEDGYWGDIGALTARYNAAFGPVTDAFAAVGTALVDALQPAFADIYDAIEAMMPPPRPRRSGKAARARAKRAKLRQRRAARELYAGRPGVDWREAAPMLRKSIASIAREGVPCMPVPCVPFTTTRIAADSICVTERTP
jgi:hypothetical protein